MGDVIRGRGKCMSYACVRATTLSRMLCWVNFSVIEQDVASKCGPRS